MTHDAAIDTSMHPASWDREPTLKPHRAATACRYALLIASRCCLGVMADWRAA